MGPWLIKYPDSLLLSPQHAVLDDCKLPYNSFELVLDKTAEITYFLDAKLLFDIPHLTILDCGFRIAEFKSLIFPLNAGLMGAKRLRRG